MVEILLGVIVVFLICGYSFGRYANGKGITDAIAYMVICYVIVFVCFVAMVVTLLIEHIRS